MPPKTSKPRRQQLKRLPAGSHKPKGTTPGKASVTGAAAASQLKAAFAKARPRKLKRMSHREQTELTMESEGNLPAVVTRQTGVETLLAFVDIDAVGLGLAEAGLDNRERINILKELLNGDDDKVRLGALKELRVIVETALKNNGLISSIRQTARKEMPDGTVLEEVREGSRLQQSLLKESPNVYRPAVSTATVLLPDSSSNPPHPGPAREAVPAEAAGGQAAGE